MGEKVSVIRTSPQTASSKRLKLCDESVLQHLTQHKTRFTAPKEKGLNREHCQRKCKARGGSQHLALSSTRINRFWLREKAIEKFAYSPPKNLRFTVPVVSFSTYTGAAYSNINAVLRGVDPSFVGNNAKYAEDLAQALSKSSLPESVRLYRGTSKEMHGALKNTPIDELVGKELVIKVS